MMKIMATGGVLEDDDTCWETFCGSGDARTSFKYTKPFDWHFCLCHAVDNHNKLCPALTSLEDTWVTQRREIRVFAFLLAITVVVFVLSVTPMRHVGTGLPLLSTAVHIHYGLLLCENACH